jgi:ribosomal protein S18 acetylase RimI-like enzyme
MAVISAGARLRKLPESGIRPFDVTRDLRPVAELIADAFAHELDQRGKSALREMRAMSYFSAIIKTLNRGSGEFDDYFGGYVWMEEDKLVGNITVQRAEQSGVRWQIANVAVNPRYRGQGIAHRLMEQALEHIHDEGGRYAVLQVYEQNSVAHTLYDHLGFEEVGGSVELELEQLPQVAALERPAGLYTFSSRHWQPLYELVNAQLGSQAQWWRTIRRSDFQLTLEQRLGEWLWQQLGRQSVYRVCVHNHTQPGQIFDAALILQAMRWGGEHKLQFWVRPERYGQVEAPMLHWALATLQRFPRSPVKVTLSKTHHAGLELFQKSGFVRQRTLLTMRKEIN